MSLPDLLGLYVGNGTYINEVPTTVTIGVDPGLGDHTIVAMEDSPNKQLTIGLIIDRPGLYQLTIYIVALLPFLLGGVVVHIWFRRRQQKFDLGFIAGLIAAMLAILPLRAVLIPMDLTTVGLTLVDNILILGVLFVATFLFAQYAVVSTQASKINAAPEPGAQLDQTETAEQSKRTGQ